MSSLGVLIGLAAVFLVVSLVFSMLGLGGGILYVPILLFAGFTMREAPAISLILILATSLSALFTFWRNRKVDWKLAALMDPPTDVMAFVGGLCSAMVPEHYLQGLLAAVLVVAGTLMLRRQSGPRAAGGAPDRWWIWRRHFNGNDYTVHIPLVLTATGAIGLLSGMLGITGGIIKLPIMVLLCGVPMDIAIATSTVMVAITALFGLMGHTATGAVDWHTGLILAIVAILGGAIGSRVSLSANKLVMKRLFGIVVLAIALRLAVGLLNSG